MSIAKRSLRCFISLSGLAALLGGALADAGSIRFFANGANDIDRVKIRVDDPANNNPGPPADIGAGNFTIEFWIKGAAADNNNTVRCGSGVYGWIDGDVVLDRDRFNLPRAFGLALGNGRVAFGANVDNVNIATHCGNRNVLDGLWHHVAVTRSTAGEIRLFVDGMTDGSMGGVAGDLSYPDNGQPEGNNCGGQPCFNSDPFIVLGAEKHDARPGQLAFNGFIDELRLSTTLRYTANFTVVTTPFSPDAATAALYHFDEATSGNCASGTVLGDAATGGASPGECRFGGAPAGPAFSADSPFASTGPGTFQFSAATYPVAEDALGVTLTVTRSGGTSGAVTVTYATADGTATANNDYTPQLNGQVAFGDGVSSQTFVVAIVNDMAPEGAENFTVTLTGASNGGTLGTPATATIAVSDDDTPGTLQLSAAAYAVAEGTPARVVTVTRLSGNAGPASVNYATEDGSALNPGDYTATSNTLTWNSGDGAPRTFSIPITNDAVIEAAESFTVRLSGASGAALASPSSATIDITDDDSAGALQFSSGAYTVSEAVGSAIIGVNRTGGTIGIVGVSFATSNGTAVAPSDYTATSGTLQWANGEGGPKTFPVAIVDDMAFEGNQALNLALSNASGGAVIGSPGSATLTITDNDVAQPGTLQLDQSSYTVAENAGALTLTVSRNNGSDGAAQVRVASTDGTALAGSDFQFLNQTLTWAAGESADKTATLAITNNSTNEGIETLTINLLSVSGATLGTPATATVTINDDDPAGGGGTNSGGGGGPVDLYFILLGLLAALKRRTALDLSRAGNA